MIVKYEQIENVYYPRILYWREFWGFCMVCGLTINL